MFISYAQNYEDVMLWRALQHVENGFYIDIGANDPSIDSVTKAFYERGWSGINIEPASEWFDKLELERQNDINLNVAAGAQEGKATLYVIPKTGLTTQSEAIAKNAQTELGFSYQIITVNTKPLRQICEEIDVTTVHFLKIDVESSEKSVLEGIDFSALKPWIILVEATKPMSQIPSFESWEPIILDAGYAFAYFDGLNRFYVSIDQNYLAESFKTPPNLFDHFIRSDELLKERKVQEYRKKLKQQTVEVVEYRSRAETLQLEIQDTKSRLQQAHIAHGELNKKYSEMKYELEVSKNESLTLSNNLESALEQNKQIILLKNELQLANEKINEINGATHHWWCVADSLRHDLEMVTKSHSWAITKPLRAMGKFVRLAFPVLGKKLKLGAIKAQSTRALRFFVFQINNHPRVKKSLLVLLNRIPSIKTWLKKLLITSPSPLFLTSQEPITPIFPAQTQLSPRAQAAYDQLISAIKEHHGRSL